MQRKVILPLVHYCVTRCSNKRGYFLLNLVGVMYTWGVIIVLLKVGSDSCPYLEGDQCPYFVAVGCFIIFECALNFACFHIFAYRNRLEFILPASDTAKLAEVGSPIHDHAQGNAFMKFCAKCNRTVPTRSHHCVLCQYCVMKSDHHCFALGGCVGFGNQRYFIVFVFWAILGSIYGAWIVARYVNAYVIPWTIYGIIDYFFPLAFIKWLLVQHCRFVDLGYILVITGGYTAFTGALLFFILQWVLIVRGQTMFELYKKKQKNQTTPLWMRIEYVFGPFWYLNFIVPLPFRNRMDESMNKFLYECQLKKV